MRPNSGGDEAARDLEQDGYPDNGAITARFEIVRGDAVGNSHRANAFEFKRQMNRTRRSTRPNGDDAAHGQRTTTR